MALLIVHACFFMLMMRAVDYATRYGDPRWLAILLTWTRLWWYAPFGIAAAAALHRWQRAIPILGVELIVACLVASPSTFLEVARIIAPLLVGYATGSLIRLIAYNGDQHGTHHSTGTRAA